MIGNLIVRLLGRSLAWRLGRSIYMAARGEVANDIASNGEAALVRAVVDACEAEGLLRIWDVGANLGNWSQVVVDACAKHRIGVALEQFEPVPATRERLAARFTGHPAVRQHPCALSDQVGAGEMDIVSATGGTNALASAGARSGGTSISVAISTGDTMLAELGQTGLHLVKIDAEGFDLKVMRGLRGALAQGAIGIVQFEYNHRWVPMQASLFEVFRLIEDLPYRLARVTPSGLEIMPEWNAEADRYFECNYALVRSDMVTRLGTREGRWDASNVLIA